MDSETPASEDNDDPVAEIETPTTDVEAVGSETHKEELPSSSQPDDPQPAPVPEPEPTPELPQEPSPQETQESTPEPELEPAPTPALVSQPLTGAEPVAPADAFCSECGVARIEGAKFCPACGHAHDVATPDSQGSYDDGSAEPLDRKWVIAAAVSAVALVLLIVALIARRDEPGPSNKHAEAACTEMTRISTEIIEGRSASFAGQLEKVMTSAQAAAKEDKHYASLAAAVKRLNEDPEISSPKGGKAVETIAKECN